MNDKNLLRLEVKLLLLKYGRKALIEAFSNLELVTIEDLEKEIQLYRSNKKAKLPRPEKSTEEVLNSFEINEDSRKMILYVIDKFRSKAFLPNLRDAITFLQLEGSSKRNVKSRQDTLPLVISSLAQMSKNRLQSIYKDLQDYGDQSDFSILANKLMGKPHRDA